MPDPFDRPQPELPRFVESEAHELLKENLTLALGVHRQAMTGKLPANLPIGEKRLAVESAHTTVKAALQTDRAALRARQENTMEIAMIRIWFAGVTLGEKLEPVDLEKLRATPRAKLEAALGQRQMQEFDEIRWDAIAD
jgi:hypothetical protein